MVWDAGLYRNIRQNDGGEEIPMQEALDMGQIEVWLEGKKLRGGYALIHSNLGGKKQNWLLVQVKDEGADARRHPSGIERQSVLTTRTLARLSREKKTNPSKR